MPDNENIDATISALSDIKAFREKVEKKGWEGIIIKPSSAAYSFGIKVFKNFKRTKDNTIKEYMERLKKMNFTSFTIAEFVPTFGKHFEIRTYWINGNYAYSIATLTKSVGKGGLGISDQDTFKSEGGNLPDDLKNQLKKASLPSPLFYISFFLTPMIE